MVDYSDILYLPGSSECDDPGKYIKKINKRLITNSVINRLMPIFYSFQSRNFIKVNKSILKESHRCSFLPVTLKFIKL